MVLAHDVHHLAGQAILLGHLRAVAGMGGEDGRGDARVGAVVGVVAHLVLLEVHGPLELTHVVVVRAHAGQQTVCAHGGGGGLGQIRHDDGVVVGAGGLHQQAAQQRLIGVRELNELCAGGQIEHQLQQRLQADGQHRAEHAAAQRPQGIGQGGVQVRAGDQADGHGDDEVGCGDGEARKQRAGAQLLAGEHQRGDGAGCEGHQHHREHGHGEQAVGGHQHGHHEADHAVDEQRCLGVQQHGDQDCAQRHGHEIGIHAPHQQRDGDLQHDGDAQQHQPLGVLQDGHVKLVQVQRDDAAEHQQQQRKAPEQRNVQRVIRQQAEAGNDLVLGLGDDLALADDDLALDQHLRLDGVPGLLAVGLGDLRVDEHVRLDADAQNLGDERHRAGGVLFVHQIPGDAGHGGGLLALRQGGVQRVAHADHARVIDLLQDLRVGAQQGRKHVLAQREGCAPVDLRQLRLRGISGYPVLPFRFDGDQRVEAALHVLQHGAVDAGVHALVAGLYRVGGGDAQLLRGHRVLHVLGGVDGLAGRLPHVDVVGVRRDARQNQHEDQQKGRDADEHGADHAVETAGFESR